LNVIPHLEYHYGAFLPKDGMQSIAKILYEQAISLGVEFHFNTEVRTIYKSNNSLTHIELPNNTLFKSDIFIANCDAKLLYRKILKTTVPQKLKKAENSSSALIFYWGIKKEFPQLDVHNIFFAEDYQKEFESIFQAKSCQEDPTIYINITSKKIKSDAPNGCENWFVMINTPCNDGQDWDTFRAEAKEKIIAKLSKTLGCDISSLIEVEEYLDPVRIEQFTGSNKGSLYGSSSNHRMSAFFRQANFSSKYKNLYFCGGSVHPGGGIPLCMLSAKILSDIIPNANSRK
jgi:phytoene desaturase